MPDGVQNQRLVVVLTAIRTEAESVCAHLVDLHEERYKGSIYRRGIFSTENCNWDVVVVQTGLGGLGAAAETERAVTHYDSHIVLFVGVAGGRKDVRRGDVVVATKIYAYDSGKADRTFQTRPEVGRPSYPLEQLAEAEARKSDWLRWLGENRPDSIPRVLLGPIAAGGSVITSNDSTVEKLLQASYNDALAVEMEGHGFLEAVRRSDQHVDALVIRGISDLIQDKSEADALNFQEIASRHASAFAFELLARLCSFHISGNSEKEPQKPETETFIFVQDKRLQEIISSIQKYYVRVKEMNDLFDGGVTIHPDQCKRAIVLMNDLIKFFERNRGHPLSSNIITAMQVNNIGEQLNELKPQLSALRRICSETRQDQKYHNLRRIVHDKFDLLLKSLEQIVKQR
jgi:nucleoside phosphorylase